MWDLKLERIKKKEVDKERKEKEYLINASRQKK